MQPPKTATRDEWLRARRELLEKEKAHTRARDELTRARQQLPWVRIEKDYRFHGERGECGLADLFGDHSQLVLQHFMFDADWDEGCKSCSFMADHMNPAVAHLAHRDVACVAVSIAPLEKLLAYRERMGWTFPWYSSAGSDFNRDFGVTFTDAELQSNSAEYNYATGAFPVNEAPGISAFARGDDGAVYHTYSVYARGLETFITAYDYLDLVPKGRDEDDLAYGMEWVRHHDNYDNLTYIDPYK